MKDAKHIRRDFHSVTWVMPPGVEFWGAWSAQGVNRLSFSNMVMWHIKSTGMMSRTELSGDLGVRSKAQISLNSGYHVNFKDFLYQTLCVFSQIKENILNRIYILLLGSCPRGGTWGCWLVKNFSMGTCDGAPSTAHSSFAFVVGTKWQYRPYLKRLNILLATCTRNFSKSNISRRMEFS